MSRPVFRPFACASLALSCQLKGLQPGLGLVFRNKKIFCLDRQKKSRRLCTLACRTYMVVKESYFLKSLGRRFVSLHFEHSATLRSLPFSYKVFITISPPHSGHSNFCVATVVREFLLAPAMTILQKIFEYVRLIYQLLYPVSIKQTSDISKN